MGVPVLVLNVHVLRHERPQRGRSVHVVGMSLTGLMIAQGADAEAVDIVGGVKGRVDWTRCPGVVVVLVVVLLFWIVCTGHGRWEVEGRVSAHETR